MLPQLNPRSLWSLFRVFRDGTLLRASDLAVTKSDAAFLWREILSKGGYRIALVACGV
jgi:hypothetical protein